MLKQFTVAAFVTTFSLTAFADGHKGHDHKSHGHDGSHKEKPMHAKCTKCDEAKTKIMEESFKIADKNSDGKLNEKEFKKFKKESKKAKKALYGKKKKHNCFKKADSDKDGLVTKEELKSYKSKPKHRKGCNCNK